MAIILASGSASRAALLRNAGVDVQAIPPRVDEETAKIALRGEGLSAGQQAMRLAEMKALKVSAREAGLVIGGDQVLSCGSHAFDKAPDMAGAARTLEQLQGRTHTLETAVVIAEGGRIVWQHLARPQLTMRAMPDAEITRYLERAGAGVLETVGAYKLEGLGAQLFSEIKGDYFSILGLPLLPLLDYLRTRGAVQI